MLALAVLSLCAGRAEVDPPPPRLDGLTLADARRLDGRRVELLVVPAKPVVPFAGVAVVGVADAGDGTERSVMFLGDVPKGRAFRCAGVLLVIRHPAAVVNGVTVPAWEEVVLLADGPPR